MRCGTPFGAPHFSYGSENNDTKHAEYAGDPEGEAGEEDFFCQPSSGSDLYGQRKQQAAMPGTGSCDRGEISGRNRIQDGSPADTK